MDFPRSTGEAARLLHCTEPQLAETVRRGHVVPEPPILAGRRLWSLEHLVQAADALGVLDDKLRARLSEEVVR